MPRYSLNDKQKRTVSKIINKRPENIHYMVMPNEGFQSTESDSPEVIIEDAKLSEIGCITLAQAFKL